MTILVPAGKLALAITMPTVKPVVSAMVMVLVAGAIEAVVKTALALPLRLRVPAFTNAPPVKSLSAYLGAS